MVSAFLNATLQIRTMCTISQSVVYSEVCFDWLSCRCCCVHFMFTFTCKCPCSGTPVLSYNLKRMTMVSGQTVPEDVKTFYLSDDALALRRRNI